MVPGIVEDRVSALRRRLESPPVARFYEESIRHAFTPLSSPLRAGARSGWLRDHGPAGEVRSVVDLGCGRGHDLRLMAKACNPKLAVGVDLSQVLLAEAARAARTESLPNVAFVRSNITDLPFIDASFGWANIYGLLHRVETPKQTMEQIAALLEPEGVFTCLTTHRLKHGSKGLGQRIISQVGRIHLFSRGDLESMLEEGNMELDELSPFGTVALLAAHRNQG